MDWKISYEYSFGWFCASDDTGEQCFHSIIPAFQVSARSVGDHQHWSCHCKLTLAALKVMMESKCSRAAKNPKSLRGQLSKSQPTQSAWGTWDSAEVQGHSTHSAAHRPLMTGICLWEQGTLFCISVRTKHHTSLTPEGFMEAPCFQSVLSIYFVWRAVRAPLVVSD